MKRIGRRLSSILISFIITAAMTAVMMLSTGFLSAAANGSLQSYAASQSVTFGILESNNTVTQVNSIDLGTFDLAAVNPEDENTYTISKTVCIRGAKNSGLILRSSSMDGSTERSRRRSRA